MRVTPCQATVGALLAIARPPAVRRRGELERTVERESALLAGLPVSAQTPAAVRWPMVQPPARPWAECHRRDAVETSPDGLVASPDGLVASPAEAVLPPVPSQPRSAAPEVLKVVEVLEPLTRPALTELTALSAETLSPQAVSQV